MARRHFSDQGIGVDRYLYRHQYDRRAAASMVKLPYFLDSIGTLISAVLLEIR